MRNEQICSEEKAVKFASNPGDPIHIIYAPKANKDGTIDLVPSGKENTDEFIQAQTESTDIRTLIARMAAGDMDALNVHKGMFGDFTDMPKTYAELLQMQIDAKRSFEKMPADIKEKFGNDVNQYLATAGEKDWFDKLGIKTDEEKPAEVVKEEVKAE